MSMAPSDIRLPSHQEEWLALVADLGPPDSLVDVALKAGESVISENLAAGAGLTIWPGLPGQRPVSAVATVIPGPEGPFGVLAVLRYLRASVV
jgi:hypothetical protein